MGSMLNGFLDGVMLLMRLRSSSRRYKSCEVKEDIRKQLNEKSKNLK